MPIKRLPASSAAAFGRKDIAQISFWSLINKRSLESQKRATNIDSSSVDSPGYVRRGTVYLRPQAHFVLYAYSILSRSNDSPLLSLQRTKTSQQSLTASPNPNLSFSIAEAINLGDTFRRERARKGRQRKVAPHAASFHTIYDAAGNRTGVTVEILTTAPAII